MKNAKLDLWHRAIAYMVANHSREHLAKSRDFEQSLFDHTLLEIDAFLQMAPILARPNHWDLTEQATGSAHSGALHARAGLERTELKESLPDGGLLLRIAYNPEQL